jgi:hypothetical protein
MVIETQRSDGSPILILTDKIVAVVKNQDGTALVYMMGDRAGNGGGLYFNLFVTYEVFIQLVKDSLK